MYMNNMAVYTMWLGFMLAMHKDVSPQEKSSG